MDPHGLKAGPCPYETNGVLRVMRTRRGRLALICDECDGTWFDRDDMSADNPVWPAPQPASPDRSTRDRRFVAKLRAWGFIPSPGPEFVFPDGDTLDRPATAEEIRAAGWDDLVPGS